MLPVVMPFHASKILITLLAKSLYQDYYKTKLTF